MLNSLLGLRNGRTVNLPHELTFFVSYEFEITPICSSFAASYLEAYSKAWEIFIASLALKLSCMFVSVSILYCSSKFFHFSKFGSK